MTARHLVAVLSTAVWILGCSQPEPSPVSALGRVTRVEVAFKQGPRTTITDSTRIAVLRAAAERPGDWHSVPDTPPAGDARAAFYRDTVFLGVLSVGPGFVGARGATAERFRRLNRPESDSIWAAMRGATSHD